MAQPLLISKRLNRKTGALLCCILTWVVSPASSESPEVARQMLQKLKIAPTTNSFFEQIKQGNKGPVKLLVDSGIPVDCKTEVGITGLMLAAETGQSGMITTLIDLHANLNLKDQLRGKTALMMAAEKGNLDIVRLLVQAGADVNARTDRHVNFGIVSRGGDSALMFAAASGSTDVVRALLQAGAIASFVDESGDTALTWATRRGNTDIIKLLNEAAKQEAMRDHATEQH